MSRGAKAVVAGAVVSAVLLALSYASGLFAVAVARDSILARPGHARTSLNAGRVTLVRLADRQYRVRLVLGGFALNSPRQRFTARFGATGVDLRAGHLLLGLRLTAYGYAHALHGISASAPRADANRVHYWTGAVSEWYVNEPAGLEQGFTLPARPVGGTAGTLTLVLDVTGNVRSVLARRHGAVVFRGGGRSLVYRSLLATDASGRTLQAKMELHGHQLLLRISDRGARYPAADRPTDPSNRGVRSVRPGCPGGPADDVPPTRRIARTDRV